MPTITPGVSSGDTISAYRKVRDRLCSRSSSSAAASPSGTASAITPAPTIRLVPSAAHIR